MAESNTYQITIDEEKQGTRLDVVLSFCIADISRSFIQKLIDEGNVAIDGSTVRSKKEKVKAGQCISITIPEPENLEVLPQDIPLDIVYEDEDVLVVNKPRGMVVHPAPGNPDGTLVNAIMHHCAGRLSTINGVIRPGIVHRIDKDTSGLLVIAKNDAAHASLAAQLEEHSITRRYRAIVYNSFADDSGTVDAPIGRDPKNRLRMAVIQGGRRAVTHYKVLERLGRFSYIEAQLETGRTHQIRVHMAYIKHPLLGDFVYGPPKNNLGADGQMLHAKVLGFVHPRTGEYMEFDSELPEEFTKVLEKVRKL